MFAKILTPTSLLWALRQVLQFGGIWLVANGHASQGDLDTVTRAIAALGDPAVIGAVSALVGFAGNVYASFRDKVTVNGQAVGRGTIREQVGAPAERDVVMTAKEAIANKPTLWERLTSRGK